MMSPESQVILRNKEYFAQGNVVIVNPTDAEVFYDLGENITGFHQFYDVYEQAYSADFARHEFNTHIVTPKVLYDAAIVYMPKVKTHLGMLLANLSNVVKTGGQIFIVGHNKSGIKSCAKHLEKVCDTVNKVDSAKHCGLFVGTVKANPKAFNLDDFLTTKTYELNEIKWEVAGMPSVFSQDALDLGTHLLLEHLPQNIKNDVLDFACGAGVIAAFVGVRHLHTFPDPNNRPNLHLVLSDIHALSLYCAQKTLHLNNLQGDVVASNGLSNVEGKFSHIITNPPFHKGINTDYSIAHSFLVQAREHLIEQGHLTLVANSFLNYAVDMEEHVGPCQKLISDNKFAVYQAVGIRPKAGHNKYKQRK